MTFTKSLFIFFVILTVHSIPCFSLDFFMNNRSMGREPVNEFLIKAKDNTGYSPGLSVVKTKNGKIQATALKPGWISYKINVPVAGRYKVTLTARVKNKGIVNCRIEDYIDNKDDRTYDITGKIPVGNTNSVSVDGSPLNAGTHLIKLHIDSGSVLIDRITFLLMKHHVATPRVYKQSTNGKEWSLVWSDEFEGTGLPDGNKWVYDIGNWGWGNNELQYYTEKRAKNARVENGNLIIEALKSKDRLHPWTSARLTSRGKESFLYGKIEFKAKVPSGRGSWSAGWLLGDNYIDEFSWPYCGEIDVLENVGYELDKNSGNGKTHASVHCGAYYFKLNNQPTAIEEVKNMTDEFHVYSLVWLPSGMTMYIDDKKYFEYQDTSTSLSWPFDKPQNIILNMAIGGGWGGKMGIDESLTSQKMIVDYVRVYELK